MLSYQHGFHAGNPADLHKHGALAGLLALLTRKDRGLTYMETHAGRGLYDLSAPESVKTGEAAEGIGQITIDSASPYGEALAVIRQQHGEHAYPGSPLIAAQFLRPQDRLILMELHPAEHEALKIAMRGTIAEIHRRDGREGVIGIAPATPRKGLILVDPSYEIKSEYEETADFTLKLATKWPEASILIWYPLLPAGRHEAMLDRLAPLSPLRREVDFMLKGGKGMTGSGLALINPPYGSEALFDEAIRLANPLLSPR